MSQELVELQGDHLNAQRFLDVHGADVRWAPELGRFYIWSGSWWEEDRTERVQHLALEVIDGLREWVTEASGDEFRRRAAHYSASSRASRVEAMLQVARPRLVVGIEELDHHPYLLACLNGEVDLRTGELHSSDPLHLMTRGVALEYDPTAESSELARVLDTTFDEDADLIAYVQRAIGYATTGTVREHVALVWHGSGANGRSTLLGAVQDILGDLALTAPEGLFTESQHEPHPERIAALRGRRLVTCFELENRAVLAEGLVKTLTGGDRLSARELYGRRFDFAPTHKVVIVTNHKPRVRGTDESIWRRLRLVPFEHTVQPKDQDGTLRQRLVADHGAALLTWVVEGAVAWFADGLGETRKVTQATAEYRAEQDTFSAFLEECTEESPRARTPVSELWQLWRTWCESTGERPGRQQSFTSALDDHGVELEVYRHQRYARNVISGGGSGSLVRTPSRESLYEKLPDEVPPGSPPGPAEWPDGSPYRLLKGPRSDHDN